MLQRSVLTMSLPALGLAAWLVSPGLVVAQHHGKEQEHRGDRGASQPSGGSHPGASHPGGTGAHHENRGAYQYGGRGDYRGGYYGGGYYGGDWGRSGDWGYGLAPGSGFGLGYPGYSGYYPRGYGYYPRGYYGTYQPWYGDYYGSYQPYYWSAEPGTYAPETYGGTYGYYEPPSTSPTPTNTARINVRVPPDAQVWFGDVATEQTGSAREFESPPLTPGKTYSYDIRARWRQGGRDITQTRHVDLHAGERVTVDFMTPSQRATQAPVAPAIRLPTAYPPRRPSGS